MANETTVTDTQNQVSADTSTASTQTEGQTNATTTDTVSQNDTVNNKSSEAKSFSQDELNDIVSKRLAKEKARWEKDKDLPEIERLKQQNLELSQKMRERDIADSFTESATVAGAKNVDRLFKIYRSDLEISEDGKIENASQILKQARADFPEFFAKATGSADGGSGNGSNRQLTVEQIVDAEFAKTGRTHAFKL